MKFVVLLMADGAEQPWDQLTPDERGVIMEKFSAFDDACAAAEGVSILAGEALEEGDSARTVRTRGGQQTVTDGPFAEAVEQLGGFFLIETPDLPTLLELLTVLPAYDMQVNPVIEGM